MITKKRSKAVGRPSLVIGLLLELSLGDLFPRLLYAQCRVVAPIRQEDSEEAGMTLSFSLCPQFLVNDKQRIWSWGGAERLGGRDLKA